MESDPYQVIKEGYDEETVLKKLRGFVDGCPACMLTAMRLTESTGCFSKFDWKKERDSFYKESIPEPEYYYAM